MEGEERFLALVHHDGIIKYRTKEGVRFTDKNPTNVFITKRTRLRDLQRSVIRKLGLDERKRVIMIYWISISVVPQGVKYVCFAIEGDGDLELTLASSDDSAPNPQSVNVGGCLALRFRTEPTFSPIQTYMNLRLRLLLAVAIAGTSRPISPHAVERVPDPLVKEVLRPDDSDEMFIEGDSDDDSGPIPTQQGGASSSNTQQYPPHYLSNLNLDTLFGPGRRDGDSSNGAQAS
ncbi:hypothetical protein PIB30_014798 [Stylosanthes scabra]|uniref:Uncharacterized protein n=1 Tax=Stylosanthes scabra TaxID=79078 RepID=A0ABU6Z5U6_9FABA|nr:hypothetical protein [Stylosanthes scabra]